MSERRIIYTKRSSDWHACLEGQPAIWGCGKSVDEAVGALVRNHPEQFGVSLARGVDYIADGGAAPGQLVSLPMDDPCNEGHEP